MNSKSAAYAGEEIRRTKTVKMSLHIAVTGCMKKECKRNEGPSEMEITATNINNYHKK
jgi:hypothetical protein